MTTPPRNNGFAPHVAPPFIPTTIELGRGSLGHNNVIGVPTQVPGASSFSKTIRLFPPSNQEEVSRQTRFFGKFRAPKATPGLAKAAQSPNPAQGIDSDFRQALHQLYTATLADSESLERALDDCIPPDQQLKFLERLQVPAGVNRYLTLLKNSQTPLTPFSLRMAFLGQSLNLVTIEEFTGYVLAYLSQDEVGAAQVISLVKSWNLRRDPIPQHLWQANLTDHLIKLSRNRSYSLSSRINFQLTLALLGKGDWALKLLGELEQELSKSTVARTIERLALRSAAFEEEERQRAQIQLTRALIHFEFQIWPGDLFAKLSYRLLPVESLLTGIEQSIDWIEGQIQEPTKREAIAGWLRHLQLKSTTTWGKSELDARIDAVLIRLGHGMGMQGLRHFLTTIPNSPAGLQLRLDYAKALAKQGYESEAEKELGIVERALDAQTSQGESNQDPWTEVYFQWLLAMFELGRKVPLANLARRIDEQALWTTTDLEVALRRRRILELSNGRIAAVYR